MADQPERPAHSITAEKGTLVIGENTFLCSHCHQPIVLVWDGEFFSLREEDKNDPNDFGTVSINWTHEGRGEA